MRDVVISRKALLQSLRSNVLVDVTPHLEDAIEGQPTWISEEIPPETPCYVLLSFDNFSMPLIGRYEENEEGGAYYIGDDEESCISQDLIVNGWMPLPEPYREDEGEELKRGYPEEKVGADALDAGMAADIDQGQLSCKWVNDWIYRNPYHEYEELFNRIEAALGFDLFVWQKSYIVTGHFRQYGETTAMILKELLDTEAALLDYTRRGMSHREDFYRRQLREIQERLKDAGIKIRVVFWSIGDKRRYAEGYKGTCEKRDCRRCPFPPCEKGESRHD